MKSFSKMRVATGVALGAVLALSYVEGTFAADCAATNTFYDGTTASGSGSNGAALGKILASADCTACPTGTTAAAAPSDIRNTIADDATPSAALKTFCEGIDADYYGTIGDVDAEHATVTECPYSMTTVGASPASDVPREDCSKSYSADPSGDDATDVFLAAGAASTSAALTLNACPEGTVAAALTGLDFGNTNTNAATKCEHIAAGYSGSLVNNDHASVTICPVDTYAIGVATETRSSCTDCPTGFDTNSVKGATARETCQKVFTSGTDAASNDVFVAATDTSSSGAFTMYACPEGTVTATPITAAAGSGSNTKSFCEVVAPNYYGDAGTAGASGAHASSVTSCPANSHSDAGSTVIGDCKCDAEYKATDDNECTACTDNTDWVTAPSVGTTATFCTQAVAGYFGAISTGADATVTQCPTNSNSPAGSTSLADCVVNAGYYVQTAHADTAGSVVTQQAPAGWVATGGVSVASISDEVGLANTALVSGADYSAANLFQCPTETLGTEEFAFTSADGSSTGVQDCYYDFDYLEARDLIKNDIRGLFVSSTSLQNSLLRLNMCPEGTTGDAFTVDQLTADQELKSLQTATYCHITDENYYGFQGVADEHHAMPAACPDNSHSDAGSTACTCDTGYTAGGLDSCVATPAAASTPTAAADSAGAAMPIAAAVAAMAMPLLI